MADAYFVYPNDNNSVALVMVSLACGIPKEEIARKDTPAGKPFLWVTKEQLPEDHSFFNAWEADFSNPDGYGIGPNAWFIEQCEAEKARLDPVYNQSRIAELNKIIEVQRAEMNQ